MPSKDLKKINLKIVSKGNNGFGLVEVIVALMILSLAGIALLQLTRQLTDRHLRALQFQYQVTSFLNKTALYMAGAPSTLQVHTTPLPNPGNIQESVIMDPKQSVGVKIHLLSLKR